MQRNQNKHFYKALLLDFDGTLFYTKDAIQDCLEKTLTNFEYSNIKSEDIHHVIS